MTRRRAAAWAGLGVFLFAANVVLVATRTNVTDEFFNLWVGARLAGGDALYRDVQFTATPLSAYLLAGALWIAGVDAIVQKALAALVAALTGLLVVAILRRGGASCLAAGTASVATVALGLVQPHGLYTAVAVLALAACAYLSLDVVLDGRGAALAGVAAGVAFASKQNVGVLAFAALAAAVVAVRPRRWVRASLAAAAGFAATAVATFVWMAAVGGAGRAADALALGKGGYIGSVAIPYGPVVEQALRWLSQPRSWGVAPTWRELILSVPLRLLPIAAAAALLAAFALRRADALRDPVLITAAPFGVAAFLTAYPRFDDPHLSLTPPGLLVALVLSARETAVPRVVPAAAAAVVAAAFVFAAGAPLVDLSRGSLTALRLPNLTAAYVPREEAATLRRNVTRLRRAVPGKKAFLLLREAGFYELTTGVRNPTRYGYPTGVEIGPEDYDDLVADAEAGRLGPVCMEDSEGRRTSGSPPELERRLRGVLRRGESAGPCRLWFAR